MIINKDKILYADTFKYKRVNSANRAYWHKLIKKYTKEEYQNDWYKYFHQFSYYENSGNPICVFYNQQLNKCIRIIQYSPSDFDDKKYKYKQYLTAWLSKIEINNTDVPELVICLLLTHNNSYKAEKLIHQWIISDIDNLRKGIQSIYEEQSNTK